MSRSFSTNPQRKISKNSFEWKGGLPQSGNEQTRERADKMELRVAFHSCFVKGKENH
jgi:hypothetical protein